MTPEYINPKSNTTYKAAPQLLEERAIPVGMKLAKEIGFIAAAILQHFYYLLVEGYGDYVTSDGNRWMHHPRWEWIENHFPGLSEWQFRQGIAHLRQLGLLKTCQPRAREWNHTNYHTLDYETLKPLILSIGGLPPIDWRATTNRLVTAHQSIEDPKQTAEQTYITAAAVTKKRGKGEDEISATQLENRAKETRQKTDLGIKPKIPRPDRSSAAAPLSEERDKQDAVDDAGISLNPQLYRQLMNYSLEQVKAAVDYYRQAKRKGKKIDEPAAWLTDCLRGQWWVKSNSVQEAKYAQAKTWMHWAEKQGLIYSWTSDREITGCSDGDFYVIGKVTNDSFQPWQDVAALHPMPS